MERITLAPGAHINVLPAEKFNRCRISINFIWPAAREWATAEALLPLVLERGYQGCPDMTELSKKLARLYGAALSVDGTMSGQSRVLTVSLWHPGRVCAGGRAAQPRIRGHRLRHGVRAVPRGRRAGRRGRRH